MITEQQLEAINMPNRSNTPSHQAARRVLLDGVKKADAAREFGISVNTVCLSCKRIMEKHEKIIAAYCS